MKTITIELNDEEEVHFGMILGNASVIYRDNLEIQNLLEKIGKLFPLSNYIENCSVGNISEISSLKEGNLVVGLYNDHDMRTNIVAGTITKIQKSKGSKVYHVKGNTYRDKYDKYSSLLSLSGILVESEIEIINQSICKELIELYDLAFNQLESGQPFRETTQKINDIRAREKEKLKNKLQNNESKSKNWKWNR